MWCAYYGHVDAAKALIEHDARVDVVFDGKDAMDCARDNNQTAFVTFLSSLPSKKPLVVRHKDTMPTISSDVLLHACKTGNVDDARVCLEEGIDVRGKGDDWSPLMWAAYYGHIDVAATLLDHGADIGYVFVHDGMTATECAKANNQMEFVSFLKKQAKAGRHVRFTSSTVDRPSQPLLPSSCAASMNPDERTPRVHVHIIIPSAYTAVLLSNGGAKIRRLAHGAHVHLTIRPAGDSPHPDDRLMVIAGYTKNVYNVIRDVIADIQATTGCNTTTNVGPLVGDKGNTYVLVPSTFATMLMAKCGAVLRQIAYVSGARFQLTPVEDLPLGTTLRRLLVHGSESSSRKAVNLIMQKLAVFKNDLPTNREDELTVKTVVPQSAMEFLPLQTLKTIMLRRGTSVKWFAIKEMQEVIITISGTLGRIFDTEDDILQILEANHVSMAYTHPSFRGKQPPHNNHRDEPPSKSFAQYGPNSQTTTTPPPWHDNHDGHRTSPRRSMNRPPDWSDHTRREASSSRGRVVEFSQPSSARTPPSTPKGSYRNESRQSSDYSSATSRQPPHRTVRLHVATASDDDDAPTYFLDTPSAKRQKTTRPAMDTALPTPRPKDPARNMTDEAPRTVRHVYMHESGGAYMARKDDDMTTETTTSQAANDSAREFLESFWSAPPQPEPYVAGPPPSRQDCAPPPAPSLSASYFVGLPAAIGETKEPGLLPTPRHTAPDPRRSSPAFTSVPTHDDGRWTGLETRPRSYGYTKRLSTCSPGHTPDDGASDNDTELPPLKRRAPSPSLKREVIAPTMPRPAVFELEDSDDDDLQIVQVVAPSGKKRRLSRSTAAIDLTFDSDDSDAQPITSVPPRRGFHSDSQVVDLT
ncbi:hypothetical protein DYB31_007687 [Aphanomyces astaci]|uniref:K Homology domain-containing protein n=2 Tax=Aphanomyces astaci TaxID=112090 RepID=A0A397ESH4_APHAT|nr:hypothetical protein DYB31_007687 [Aphanomyces astaci]